MVVAEFEQDGGNAGEGAERGHQQNQKAAVILQHRVAADMRKPAAKHQGVDQQQIKHDEDIPADQEARHQPHRGRQFLRSATNRAAARSTSPLAPKIASAESARPKRSRTRCLAPSIPSWVTKVVLPKAASLPVSLPRAVASPSTSSRSSAI